MQPLNLMHSSLPGSGYEVKFVLFPVFQMRPGLSHPVGGGGGGGGGSGGGGGGLPVVVQTPLGVEPPQLLPLRTAVVGPVEFHAAVEELDVLSVPPPNRAPPPPNPPGF